MEEKLALTNLIVITNEQLKYLKTCNRDEDLEVSKVIKNLTEAYKNLKGE